MSATQVNRFVDSMTDQGVGVTRTKKGLFLRLPDGSSTSVHFTTSDVRALPNLMTRLRRAGVRHPDDTKDVTALPSNITDVAVAERTKRRVREAIATMGYPEYVTVMDVKEVTGMEHVTISRALYALDFVPVRGKRNGRDWMTPQDILSENPEEVDGKPAQVEPESITFQPDDTAVPTPDDEHPEPEEPQTIEEPQVEPAQRIDFIDERDSWVPDMKELLGVALYAMVKDRLQVLSAVGIEFEIRVWRTA